jgi:hypothetical protein
VGSVGVTLKVRRGRPLPAAVLPPGWHFVRNGRLVLVAEAIDTGEWPVSIAAGVDPMWWVRATCEVFDPGVAALVVVDLPTAIVQQLRTAVRTVAAGQGSLGAEQIAGAASELLEPVFRRWGVSIREMTVRDALSQPHERGAVA